METDKPIHIVIADPIFHLPVHLLLNHTPEQFIRWERKRFTPGEEGAKIHEFDGRSGFSYGIFSSNRTPEFVIWIREFTWSIKSQRTLIHELMHVIVKIWSSNHVPVNADTQEFLCCSIDGLFGEAVRKLQKRVLCRPVRS